MSLLPAQTISQRIVSIWADSRYRTFWIAIIALSAAFFKPLLDLLHVSLNTELYSHIPLIPLVSIYFAWSNSESLSEERSDGRLSALIAGLAGLALIGFYLLNLNSTSFRSIDNYLAITIGAYILLIASAGIFLLGYARFKHHLFSFAFLLFMVPMPLFFQDWVNIFFQHTSAEAANALLAIAQVPVFRESSLSFQLPTMTMQVAPECSGIRSSLVLLITSVVGGQLFLRSKLNRFYLSVFIVPLAIVRNGFRIATIGYLCANHGAHMIDSWIHHKGGPFFFALSLIPFFIFLLWLWNRDRHANQVQI